jgi:N-acyl-D-amino-acid deacylase
MKTITCVVALLGLVASVHAQIPDFTPQTPLLGALMHDDDGAARTLLESGADPNQGRFAGLPPLFLALARQNLSIVRLMVARGVDLSVRDRSGSTALMWAASSETGDSMLVEELLTLGADPDATNNIGETALDWALRRGHTTAVDVLRRAGASNARRVKASLEKSIALLQRSGQQFATVSGCHSCHHQSLPQMAFAIARTRGIAVDDSTTRARLDAVVTTLKTVADEAVRNRDRIPDPPIGVSYALVGLAAEHYPANDVTEAMTRVIAAWQDDDGGFHTLPTIRPPLEASAVTATALSVRALKLYGTSPEQRIARARDWLRTVTPRTTEERAMQVLGLVWSEAASKDVRSAAEALISLQRAEGGWAQLPALESDAYATGQALVALNAAGFTVTSAPYQRGVDFLLRTQFPDGSWLVRSRTFPVQPPKDTGFPHAKHQWISAAGTSWAAMALGLVLPETPPTATN